MACLSTIHDRYCPCCHLGGVWPGSFGLSHCICYLLSDDMGEKQLYPCCLPSVCGGSPSITTPNISTYATRTGGICYLQGVAARWRTMDGAAFMLFGRDVMHVRPPSSPPALSPQHQATNAPLPCIQVFARASLGHARRPPRERRLIQLWRSCTPSPMLHRGPSLHCTAHYHQVISAE